jgi:pimeloyl-ACP methyl ester carboxylesterase
VATRLAADHRVVLYDHRGHGRSTVGGAPLTLDTLADDLRLVLDHVDARDAVLAGHSMGGMTVQSFALRHPDALAERVTALALVATAGHGVDSGSGGRVGPAVNGLSFVGPVLASGSLGRVVMRGAVGEVACRSHIDAVIETFGATAPAVRAGFQRALLAMDFRAGLVSVDLPVVIVSGTEDNVTPHPLSRSLAELLPGARLVTLPGMGHMLPWEAPDRVVTEIARLARAAPVVSGSPPPPVG